MFKVISLISLVAIAGCVKLPNFPTFFSHQDLVNQERELDNFLQKD